MQRHVTKDVAGRCLSGLYLLNWISGIKLIRSCEEFCATRVVISALIAVESDAYLSYKSTWYLL